jgi:hypothetical protein
MSLQISHCCSTMKYKTHTWSVDVLAYLLFCATSLHPSRMCKQGQTSDIGLATHASGQPRSEFMLTARYESTSRFVAPISILRFPRFRNDDSRLRSNRTRHLGCRTLPSLIVQFHLPSPAPWIAIMNHLRRARQADGGVIGCTYSSMATILRTVICDRVCLPFHPS